MIDRPRKKAREYEMKKGFQLKWPQFQSKEVVSAGLAKDMQQTARPTTKQVYLTISDMGEVDLGIKVGRLTKELCQVGK